MKFRYQARDEKGIIQKGIIEASSKDIALEVLANQGFYPTLVEEEGASKGVLNKKIVLFSKVSLKDLVMFSRQLCIMIDANVSPAEAIDTIGSQTKNSAFREKIHKIASDVRSGTVLSQAFAKYPNIFSVFYVNMVKSGEASGDLPRILERIAEHLESEYAIRAKTTSAMIYPVIILVIFVLIFSVLMVFVIPGLVEVLLSSGQELPIATKIVISISNTFVNYWYIILVGLLGIISFFIFYPKTKEGKEFFDNLLIRIPIFGKFLKNLLLARFAENLATLITAGIHIAEALDVVASLMGNNLYERAILDTKKRVVKGEAMSYSLAQYPDIFSPLVVQMVSVGEKTGRLDSSLMNIVRFYKREAENFIDSISSIIEPILMIGLAIMVGFLVAAVILPIYQISTTISE